MKITLALLLILVVACTPEPEYAQVQDSKPVPLEEVDPVEPETEPSEDAKAELELLFNKKPNFKGQYKVTNSFQGEEAVGVQNIAIKGEKTMQSTDSDSLFVIPDGVFVCQKGEEWECYDIPQETPPEQIDVSIPEDVSVRKLSDRTLLGVNTKCFEIDSDAEGKATHCFSPEGILLYFQRSVEDFSVLMEMTAYSTNVDDSEFVLPAPAQALPEEFQNPSPR